MAGKPITWQNVTADSKAGTADITAAGKLFNTAFQNFTKVAKDYDDQEQLDYAAKVTEKEDKLTNILNSYGNTPDEIARFEKDKPTLLTEVAQYGDNVNQQAFQQKVAAKTGQQQASYLSQEAYNQKIDDLRDQPQLAAVEESMAKAKSEGDFQDLLKVIPEGVTNKKAYIDTIQGGLTKFRQEAAFKREEEAREGADKVRGLFDNIETNRQRKDLNTQAFTRTIERAEKVMGPGAVSLNKAGEVVFAEDTPESWKKRFFEVAKEEGAQPYMTLRQKEAKLNDQIKRAGLTKYMGDVEDKLTKRYIKSTTLSEHEKANLSIFSTAATAETAADVKQLDERLADRLDSTVLEKPPTTAEDTKEFQEFTEFFHTRFPDGKFTWNEKEGGREMMEIIKGYKDRGIVVGKDPNGNEKRVIPTTRDLKAALYDSNPDWYDAWYGDSYVEPKQMEEALKRILSSDSKAKSLKVRDALREEVKLQKRELRSNLSKAIAERTKLVEKGADLVDTTRNLDAFTKYQ